MNTQLLKQEIAQKLDGLNDLELQTILDLVDFLACRSDRNLETACSSAILKSDLPDNDLATAPLHSVKGILVLQPAIEPVTPKILATALQDTREERSKHLMAW